MRIRTLIFIGVMVLFVGCSKSAPQSADQLKGRLTAAVSLMDLSRRDDALSSIINDAADGGHAEIVHSALGSISNLSKRDAAAKSAALKLVDRGDTETATIIAKKISNISTRDEVLGRIAKN